MIANDPLEVNTSTSNPTAHTSTSNPPAPLHDGMALPTLAGTPAGPVTVLRRSDSPTTSYNPSPT
jgi:hypothetical protein